MHVQIGKISFKNIHLNKSQIPKFRGAISGQFKQFDLLHNHDSKGKVIYRYPAVQFKIEHNNPVIYAIGQNAIDIFKPIFLKIENINIDKENYICHEKEFSINSCEVRLCNEQIVYKFISPWIALNQDNYKKFNSFAGYEEKEKMLSSILINNIIAFSKYIGYTIPEKLIVSTKLKPNQVLLKGEKIIGFTGIFKINFLLPQALGLGKSTSRGFGVVEKVI